MSLGSNWIAEVRATVGRDGTVRAMDKRYYCADLLRYIGWDVTVLLPVDEGAPAQVWCHQHCLCSPDLMAEVGFFDHEGAQATVVEYRAKRAAQRQLEDAERASIIRGQAEALLDLIDSRVGEARRRPRILGVLESQTLTRSLKRLARGAGLFGVKSFQNPEQEGVVALDPGLEKAEAVLKHLHAVFGGHLHGEVPVADEGEPSPPSDTSQRLCRAAEKSQAESGVGGGR